MYLARLFFDGGPRAVAAAGLPETRFKPIGDVDWLHIAETAMRA